MTPKLLALLTLLLLCDNLVADDLHLIVSGTSLHAGSNNFNEKNHGLGFEYDFEEVLTGFSL